VSRRPAAFAHQHPLNDEPYQVEAEGGVFAIELERPVGADRSDLHIGLAEGGARPTAIRGEHTDLANERAGAERDIDLGHPNRPAENQEHRVRRVPKPE
jgi:hypothetical protein